jgi:glc operon protein GlcG
MIRLTTVATVSAIVVLASIPMMGQQQPAAPPTTPYGAPLTLEAAKKAMAAAEAEAAKNNWPLAIAIVSSTGHLVMLHAMDNTQYGSIRIAEGKAVAALDFRRPTKVFEDGLAAGGTGLRTLSFGITVAEGGLPIIVDGRIVGAIGASGALSTQDAQAAKAGADAIK